MTRQPDRDEEAVKTFVERYAAVLTESGFPRMPARIFVALMASERGRMTAAELAEGLHSSPAAISGGVRWLTQNYLVSREREPGSRRDVYVVHDDALMESSVNRSPLVARWAAQLREGLVAVGPDTAAGHRVAMNLAFTQFLLDEMEGMVKRWDAYKATLLEER